MVELCELKLMGNRMEGWPSTDIDQHVAQLDFDNTASIEQSLMFASIMLDPSIILSTDSLDMEQLRMRCENNKNDYKLTFEDSGQWTTSGIGASLTTTNSPPTPLNNPKRRSLQQLRRQLQEHQNTLGNHPEFGLRLLEELNNAEESRKIDTMLNNVVNDGTTNSDKLMTTWGRIRSAEPPFDDKTISLPELNENLKYENTNRIPSASMCSAQNDNKSTNIRYQNAQFDNNSYGRPHSTNIFGLPPPPPQLPSRADKYIVSNNSATSSTSSSGALRNRPPSLLANFVENQQSREEIQQNHYEYREHYIGNGRYVDLNENEIGYVPTSHAAIQRTPPLSNSQGNILQDRWQKQRSFAQAALTIPSTSQQELQSGSNTLKNYRRTFADLSPSHTAPNLHFLSLPYKVPSFCRSSTVSLDEMLKKAKKIGITTTATECCLNNSPQILFESSSDFGIFKHLQNEPDSGLGSASSSGPSHIEDWPSLAVNVVEACSFFKTNSSLLFGSSSAQSNTKLGNNIEKNDKNSQHNITSKCTKCNATSSKTSQDAACRTCFNARRKRLHPPNWATTPNNLLCDCLGAEACACCVGPATITTSDIVVPSHRITGSEICPGLSQQLGLLTKLKLHSEEFRLIGMPIYDAKRNLVEKVVEGVAEIARGASAIVLWSALERLLADGLNEQYTSWTVIVNATFPGVATSKIFQIVKSLEASEKPENSRINHFFKEVLKLHSLDGWLSYVILKEKVLSKMYTESAFMLRANNAYRSLFWRLIESLELLSVLTQCHQHPKISLLTRANTSTNHLTTSSWSSASRLPTDSRVPKSSSVPSRLTSKTSNNKKFSTLNTPVKEDKKCDNSLLSKAILNRVNSTLSPVSIAVSQAEMVRSSSRIPVIHRSRSTHSSSTPTNPQIYGGELSTPMRPNTLPLRSRSTQARIIPIIAKVRENIDTSGENLNNFSTPLEAGERVRVLSVRGPFSRCCRLKFRSGELMNVALPTRILDLC